MNNVLLNAIKGGKTLLAETKAYQIRVIADGGVVNDIKFVDAIFKFCKTNNIISNGLVGVSAQAGVRYNAGKVDKLYNLFSTKDAVQTTPSKMCATFVSPYMNNRYVIELLGGQTYQIPSITLPAYTDKFLTGNFVGSFYIAHSASPSTQDGYLFYGSTGSSWYLRRTTGHFADVSTLWGQRKGTHRWRYNNGDIKVYKNKVSLSFTPGGTQKTNISVTDNLNLFSANQTSSFSKGTACDYFEFTQLNATISNNFESLLYDYQPLSSQYSNINLMVDGDSQGAITAPQVYSWVDLMNQYVGSLVNNCVGGQTSTQMLSNFQTHLDANYIAGRDNVCVFLIGVNDFVGTQNITTTINNTNSAVALANSKGFRTFVITQRQWGTSQGKVINFSIVQNWRNAIIANASANNYTVIDIAADSRWFNVDACDDLRYYNADKIHLTNLAAEIFQGYVYNAIIQ